MDWEGFSMESFKYISDGEKQHLCNLPTSWQPSDFHRKWKICPLFASMWLHLFSNLSQPSTTASSSFGRTPSFRFVQYLKAAEKNYRWTPSPAQVFKCMASEA